MTKAAPAGQGRATPQYARGYTIVELLMSIAVLTVGVGGIMAMQKITVTANQHAKNLAIATHIAQAWQEQLAVDGLLWNRTAQMTGGRDLAVDPVWLRNVETNQAGVWFQPAFDKNRDFGPGFDALGNVVDIGTTPDRVQFCTHVRLSSLYSDQQPVAGNGLLRAEVRVFWVRASRSGIGKFCDPNASAATIGAAVERYHFVYKTSAVREATGEI